MSLDLFDFSNALISTWILSNDPMEGDLWDEACMELGLDPDLLAIAAEQYRKRHPRLNCGHYNIPENTYVRFGKPQCRTCAGTRDSVANRPERTEAITND